MKAHYHLSAETRQQHGKRVSRRMRHLQDQVPGILYGADKDTVSIKLAHNELKKALEHENFYSSILTLKLDGVEEKVILKALQRHAYKPRLLHVDFLRINPKEKLDMNIPLHFKGGEEAPGLKEGGVISHLLNDAQVRCLPADLPEFIEVDLSHLEMNQSVRLSDLKLPPNVKLVALLHDQDQTVASLYMPQVIEEEPVAAPEEGAAAPAEGEASAAPEKAAPTAGKSDGKPSKE
jgi:large subunit ribosomal protein L25